MGWKRLYVESDFIKAQFRIGVKGLLLLLINGLYRIRKHVRPRQVFNPARIQSILLVEMAYLGDIVCMTPLIHTLAVSMSTARLDVVIDRKYTELLDSDARIRTIHGVRAGEVRSVIQAILSLRRNSYDLVVCVSPGVNNSLISLLSGKYCVSGYLRYRTGNTSFYNDYSTVMIGSNIIGHYSKNEHLTIRAIKSIYPLGLNLDSCSTDIVIKVSAAIESEKLAVLKSNDVIESGKICMIVHPCASWEFKQWPIDNMVVLLNEILSKYENEVCIILIGLSSEKDDLERIVTRVNYELKTLMDADLHALVILMKNCDLFLGNDSGPKHIAGAFNKPIVELLGPSRPETVGVLNENSHRIYSNVACSPCTHSKCENNGICMRSIDNKTVLDHLCSIINQIISTRN